MIKYFGNVGVALGTEVIRGIVLKEMLKGETSKQIIVLAKGLGKVWITAKGARKQKSKLLAGTQLFCYCDFQVYESKKYYYVDQIDMIESFFDLRLDIDKLSQAFYIVDLVEKTAFMGIEQDNILLLLLKTMQILSKGKCPPTLVSRIFEMKFLQTAGVMPDLTEKCCICGKEAKQYFHVAAGGMVCNEHIAGSRKLSTGAKNAMEFVFSHDIKSAFQFSVSEEVMKELYKVLEEYIAIHINIQLQTRDFNRKIDI